MDPANPYLPPQDAAPAVTYVGMSGERPKYFMFACIGTLVLGSLGVLAGLYAPISLFVMKSSPIFGGSLPPEMKRFEDSVREASMPVLMAVIGGLNLLVSAWNVWTAALLIRQQRGSRGPFRVSTLGLSVFDAMAFVASMVVQWRVWDTLHDALAKAVTTPYGSRPPPEAEKIVEAALQFGLILGIVFAVAWLGCKVGFLLWARGYAGKPEMAAYIDGTTE